MAVNSSEESRNKWNRNSQYSYCILVSPDEGTTEARSESPLNFLSYSERDNLLEGQMCLDDKMKCENNATLPMDNIDVYPHCVLDMGDNGDPRMLRNNSETMEKLKIEEVFKNESPLTKVLQRQISLPVGEKLVKLLMNDRFALPKFNCIDKSAPMHETPTFRSRKYKRSASFSSRKVVLLFSVLSSLGTMVLIYLTLRVRQMGDNYLHT